MRTLHTIALISGLALAGPAMAQTPGFFGAPSGHNNAYSAGSYGDVGPNPGYGYDREYEQNGWDRPAPYAYGWDRPAPWGYGYAPGRDSFGVANPSGAIEGRAAAEDDAPPPRPYHRRRPVDADDMGQ